MTDGRRRLGLPRVHHRVTTSTNDRARELAVAGAEHGTLVTADEQTAGRGRQGRTWSAPVGRAVVLSLVLREPGRLLTLAAGVAVAEVVAALAGLDTEIRWPNDVVLGDGRKVAGILAEARPQEGWAVLGIGVNVAVRPGDLPPQLRARAGSMDLAGEEIPRVLDRLLAGLERWLAAPADDVLEAWARRDALVGRAVRWAGGGGTAAGVDEDGRLMVARDDGRRVALEAGEVHLEPS